MTQQIIDLKTLEKQAFKSFFQDGLWDIYLGLLLLNMGLGMFLVNRGVSEVWALVFMLVFAVLAMLAFRGGKKLFTIPRLGQVEFGPKRQARLKSWKSVLMVAFLMGLGAFVVAVLAYVTVGNNPQSGLLIAFLPGLAFGLTAITVFSLGAYYLDFERLYAYGFLYALPFPLSIVLAEKANVPNAFPLVFSVAAGIMIVVGAALLLRFLRRYPQPAQEGADAGHSE